MQCQPSRNREARRIFGVAAVLAVAFALFVRVTPWRAELAESNFQANLIRLQAFLFGPPPRAVLVGSSLSGRLLPSYFTGTQLAPVANLGLDGSGPLHGLDLVLKRPPPVVIVEANTLLRPPNENDVAIDAAVQGLNFRLAKYLPMLRAEERPSSMLYNWIKGHQKGTEDQTPNSGPGPAQSPKSKVQSLETVHGPRTTVHGPEPVQSPKSKVQSLEAVHSPQSTVHGREPVQSPKSEVQSLETVRVQIGALRARGCRVVIVRLPTGSLAEHDPNFAAGTALAQEYRLPELDLLAECSSRGQLLSYSDGLHMAPGTAREVSRLIAELVAQGEARAAGDGVKSEP